MPIVDFDRWSDINTLSYIGIYGPRKADTLQDFEDCANDLCNIVYHTAFKCDPLFTFRDLRASRNASQAFLNVD